MDNRNNQHEYNGINAQRRNRRKTSFDGEQLSLFEAAAPQETELPGDTMPIAALKEPAETPAPEAAEAAPEVFPVPETEPAAEPVTATEETGVPAAFHALTEEMKPAEEAAEAPEGDAAEEKNTEPAAAQGPDSRVPPEARRMAAAPYGAARPEARRPGTRPRTEYRRPAMPERKPIPAPPRREFPAGSHSLEETAAARPVRQTPRPSREIPGGTMEIPLQHRNRLRVGYAPGRMNDEETQAVPTQEAVRESLYARDAKAYLEKRRQPFRTEGGGNGPVNPGPGWLRLAVVLLVAGGLLLTGWMLLRGGKDGKPAMGQPLPKVMNFQMQTPEGQVAPVDLTFSAETETEVNGLRLRGENDEDLDTVATYGDNAENKPWIMKMYVEKGYNGTVTLQARRNGDETWHDTEFTVDIRVESPPEGVVPVTPEPAPTPAPEAPETEAPAGEPEETPDIPEDEETDGPETPAKQAPEDLIPGDGELRTVEPTATPAPEAEKPTETPPLVAEAAPEANPDLITNVTIYTSFTKKEKAYSRLAKELIHMPAADEYTTNRLGVLTFRGDNFRRNAAIGTLRAEPLEMKVLWQAEAGSARGVNQTYYGYGWPGQPAIARWSTQVRKASNLYESKQEKDALKEVIIAGLDGNIRFLDLEDGSLTRNSIKLGYPMRGTPSLHTWGAPFMSVGQFARKMKVKTGKIGLRQYNLYSQKEQRLIDGLDGKYHRPVNDTGSFETSALVDRISDTLIVAGSNGMLYLEALNSNFDYKAGVMSISPSITVMTSQARGQKNKALTAVESSLAAYDRYVYYADMGGVLRCIDTNTLTPVWAVETGDSVMAAVALDLTENRELDLYTANMLNNRRKGDGEIQIRKYDALSGKEIWTTDVGVTKGKKDKADVGAKASPVIGQNKLSGLVYFTVTGISDEGREQLRLPGEEKAALIALDKQTGNAVWAFGLESRSESSPIAVYDREGNGWIVQCEQNGTVHLLDGLTGREKSSLNLEAEIEASPAAYGNVVVIGTTGKGTSFVYGIELKMPPEEEAEETETTPAPPAEETPRTEDEYAPDEETEEETAEYPEGNNPAEEEYDEYVPEWEEGA